MNFRRKYVGIKENHGWKNKWNECMYKPLNQEIEQWALAQWHSWVQKSKPTGCEQTTNKNLKSGNGHITYHTTQLPATKAMQAFHPKATEKIIINGLMAGSKQVS